jgi:hypothetical protein
MRKNTCGLDRIDEFGRVRFQRQVAHATLLSTAPTRWLISSLVRRCAAGILFLAVPTLIILISVVAF